MDHFTQQTSVDHYKTYNARDWYDRILGLMREEPETPMCIADVAHSLEAEKSTISARMNELFRYGDIEYVGTKPSRATGIKSRHFRIKLQPTLI